MLKVAIIEDERPAADLLARYVERYGEESGVEFDITVYGEPTTFLDTYRPDYDIVFMDIEMPNMDGMEAARRLRGIDRRAVLVFVTNVARLAIRGYEVDAYDYIVKPVDYRTFARKLRGAAIRCRRDEDSLMLTVRGGMRRIQLRDVVYVEVTGHTLHFHSRDGGETAVGGTMGDIERRLREHGFLRCGKAYLANRLHIADIGAASLTMDDGTELPIGRAYRRAFLEGFAAAEGNAHVG
ncbi:LytR/AlgR family response regulator transcription factor [Bifidobacterium phasiani]|uniref:Response regulator transcription factor n=1 Tax=Bifidobacterium phasiani TaxID=2834431 RepID=A0ABS6W9Z2_9BIFI|nr:LytTR family DNA-binding domain-containing protein [Bifidobacterium phasiani]MBW3083335.1 response regulator transcription factor [Bifidobacterium phasiani]